MHEDREIDEESEGRIWSDAVADEVIKRHAEPYVCEGMWTPSGYFHIGNARAEIFSPFAVKHSLVSKGHKVIHNFIIDDFDGIKKIPLGVPVSEADKGKFIGKPCALAPSPFPGHKFWSDAFTSQVIEYLPKFGVEVNVSSAYQTYKSGKLNNIILHVLDNSKKIAELWTKIAGAEKAETFIPLQVVCEKCQGILTTEVTKWNPKTKLVSYKCACGQAGDISPLNGNTKLHWRVHWAAFWYLNKVDYESAGKDHFSKGGSVDFGRALMKEIFKANAPVQTPTEFIQVGGKKMSGSVGNLFDLKQWFEVAAPELFRYLNFSYKSNSVVEFSLRDNSFVLLNDRYERAERIFYGVEEAESPKMTSKLKRAYELSLITPPEKRLVQVPFTFCVQLCQLLDPVKQFDKILEILKNTKHTPQDITQREQTSLMKKLSRTKEWVLRFAPEEYKLSFLESLTDEIKNSIPNEAKSLLSEMIPIIQAYDAPEDLQTNIYNKIKEKGQNPRDAFPVIYSILIGKKAGPKIGTLILAIGKDRVIKRLNEIA